MENTVIPYDALLIDCRMGIEDAVVTDRDTIADIYIGIDATSLAYLHALSDVGEMADISLLANGRCGGDEGSGIYT